MSNSKFPRHPLSEKSPYHLNEFKEREIIYFCLQYPDWKKRLNAIRLARGTGEWDDPTADEAIERAICEKNMKIVEDACKKVYPEEWSLLLIGVTDQDSPWYNLKLVKEIHCGKDKYYELKHQVYFIVSQKDYRG